MRPGHIATIAAWWLAVYWLWMLLVGEWNQTEWAAAGIAATLTALVAELAWRASGLRVSIPWRDVASVWSVPAIVVSDFCTVVGSFLFGLFRGRIVRGRFVVGELEAEKTGLAPRLFGSRAWRGYAATISPNAYPIEIDEEERAVLLHDLVVVRKSEEPVV